VTVKKWQQRLTPKRSQQTTRQLTGFFMPRFHLGKPIPSGNVRYDATALDIRDCLPTDADYFSQLKLSHRGVFPERFEAAGDFISVVGPLKTRFHSEAL